MRKNFNLMRLASLRGPLLAYFPIGIYALFAVLLALRHGLCCADDGSFAVVSKNLASGLGYVLTLNYSQFPYTAQAFPPELGLGPTSIFFVAAFVRIFGNLPWVPSVASVILNCIFLGTLTDGLSRIVSPRRTAIALMAFLLSAVFINYANAGYWFTQFGEIPAILATLSAYVWWCDPNRSAGRCLMAGIFLALGYLTKELNAIYLLPIGIGALYEALSQRKTAHLGLLIVGSAILVVCFETYRWISLGSLSAYLDNWKQHIEFIAFQNSRSEASLFDAIKAKDALFGHQFAVPMWFVLLATGVVAFLTKGSKSARLLTGLLVAAIYLHLSYWLFKSPGWTRYAYEALIMFSLLMALSMATASNRRLAVLAALVIVIVVVRHKNEITDPNEQLRGQLQQTWMTPTMDSDRRVLSYLLAHSSGNRVYVQWWAEAPNVEYLSPRPLLFQHWAFHLAGDHLPYLMVTNSRLMNTSDAPFYAALARCGLPKLEAPPYRVYQCPPM